MKSYHLKWTSHLPNMGQVFNTLYQSEGLTDVTICCGDGNVKAHKLILSTCSDYFLELFLENIGKQTYVVLPDVKVDELKQILSFIYTGQIEVTDDSLAGLLSAADTLGVRGLNNSTSPSTQDDDSEDESVDHQDEPVDQDDGDEELHIHTHQQDETKVKSEPVHIKTEADNTSSQAGQVSSGQQPSLSRDVIGADRQSPPGSGGQLPAQIEERKDDIPESMDQSQPLPSQQVSQNLGVMSSPPSKSAQINQQIYNMQNPFIPGLLSGSLASQQHPLTSAFPPPNMTSPFPGNIATTTTTSSNVSKSTTATSLSNSLANGLTGNLGASLTTSLASSLSVSLAASLPGNMSTSVPANLGASLPGNLGASLTNSLGASLTNNLGASLSGGLGASLAASLPGSLGASLTGSLGTPLPANLTNLEAMYQQVQNQASPVKILPKMSISDEESSPTKLPTISESGKIQLELDHEAIKKIMENASTPICPMCNKDCANLPNLRSHLQVHNNLKPFACKFCDAKFARVSHLNRHIRTHTGEKPFSCNLCNKSFARQDKLKVHMQRHTKDGTLQLELIVGKKRKKSKSAVSGADTAGQNAADITAESPPAASDNAGANQQLPALANAGGYNPNALWNGFPPTIASMYEQYEPVYPGMMQYNNSTGGMMRIGECSIKPVGQS